MNELIRTYSKNGLKGISVRDQVVVIVPILQDKIVPVYHRYSGEKLKNAALFICESVLELNKIIIPPIYDKIECKRGNNTNLIPEGIMDEDYDYNRITSPFNFLSFILYKDNNKYLLYLRSDASVTEILQNDNCFFNYQTKEWFNINKCDSCACFNYKNIIGHCTKLIA